MELMNSFMLPLDIEATERDIFAITNAPTHNKMKNFIYSFLFCLTATFVNAQSKMACGPFGTVYVSPEVGAIVPVTTSLKILPEFNTGQYPWCPDGTMIDSGFIRIHRSADLVLVDSIDLNNTYSIGTLTYWDTIEFDLNVVLDYNTEYFVTMDIGSMHAPCCSSGGHYGDFGFLWGYWDGGWTGFDWEFITEELITQVVEISTQSSRRDPIVSFNMLGQFVNEEYANGPIISIYRDGTKQLRMVQKQ